MNQMFYIMKAHHLTTSGRKLGLAKVAREQGPCTIILATRHYGYGKAVKAIITGCAGDYGVKAGDQSKYTIDTGMGYKNQGERLDIEQVIQVDADGAMIEADGQSCEPQPVPKVENQYTWVMK
jgi:hypothetical protein